MLNSTQKAIKANRYLHRQPVASKTTLALPNITYDSHIPGRNKWILLQEYIYFWRDVKISLPAGLCYNLSSIPRILWPIIAPFELTVVAPLLHDPLYQTKGKLPRSWIDPWRSFSRSEANEMFSWIMYQEGVEELRRKAAGTAVGTLGWLAWRHGVPFEPCYKPEYLRYYPSRLRSKTDD